MSKKYEWPLLLLAIFFMVCPVIFLVEVLTLDPYGEVSGMVDIGWMGSLISYFYLRFTTKKGERSVSTRWTMWINFITLFIYLIILVLIMVALTSYPIRFNFR